MPIYFDVCHRLGILAIIFVTFSFLSLYTLIFGVHMLSSYIVYFMRFVITVFNVYCLLAHVLVGELTTLQTRHITVQQ